MELVSHVIGVRKKGDVNDVKIGEMKLEFCQYRSREVWISIMKRIKTSHFVS